MREMQKTTTDATGISKLDLKRQNRMYVLRYLRNEGPTCRVDIADGTGLTKAAVTIIINEMIDDGVLCERGEQPPGGEIKVARGRKKILVDINETFRLVLGLMLDGDEIILGLCTLRGRTVEKQTRPIPAGKDIVPLLKTIREMYESILYKNDLKPEMLAGMGVCVSSEHYERTGLYADERGRIDYGTLETGLKVFCDLPMAFGTVAEGAAVAEIDFQPEGKHPPMNVAVLRTDRDLDAAVIIGRELYRGTAGRPGELMKIAGSPARKVLYPEVYRRVYQGLKEPSGRDFREELLRLGVNDPMWLFCKATFRTASPYYGDLLMEIENAYHWMYSTMLYAYAPDYVCLIGEGGVERAVENAARRINRPGNGVELGLVRRSVLREFDLFKGAAALATREFFINRGGF